MTRLVLNILAALTLLLLLSRCAQMGELTGGKKDATPPKLLKAIPEKGSTGFNSDKIVLVFDEFVQIKDLSNQLIVSPKLKTTPDITANGKTVVIELEKSELAPNTTYRFYLGNAIADMNESNSIKDFEYVFSTGTHIDSLKLKGTVTDAFNGKPAGKVVVGLYKASQATDSTIYKEAPDYLARTNDDGSYAFRNLPYGSFKMYALADGNKNNMYDGEAEKVGFRDSVLNLRSDSSINLKVFQEESVKSFIKKTLLPYYGFGQIILNKKAKVSLLPLKPELAPHIIETKKGREKDTIAFFYKELKDTVLVEVDNISFKKRDTVRLVIPKNNLAKKRLKTISTNLQSGVLPLGGVLRFTFQNWMDTTKAGMSKIKLFEKKDSLYVPLPVKGHWTSITEFELDNRLPDGNFRLKIDTMAFFDIYGFKNDSLKSDFKTQSKTEFGKVTLKLLLNKKQSYVIQLVDGSDRVVQEKYISLPLAGSNAVSLEFTDVVPGTYMVKIIFDDNENRKWDSGNILAKKQAERVIINSKQIKVLSDWEIEEEITVKE